MKLLLDIKPKLNSTQHSDGSSPIPIDGDGDGDGDVRRQTTGNLR